MIQVEALVESQRLGAEPGLDLARQTAIIVMIDTVVVSRRFGDNFHFISEKSCQVVDL